MAETEWVPSPRHLLRLACIGDVTSDWQPGRLLEVGAGTGHVTETFVERGFDATLNDLGERSRELLRDRFEGRARVVDSLAELERETFSYLMAFEVLEHIEDDRSALSSWLEYLEPGGRLLVSVPAHQAKFGDADRAVGHVRRYEHGELEALFASAGLEQVAISNYGFPLGNVLRHTQTLMNRVTGSRPDDATDEQDRIDRTIESGVATESRLNRMGKILKPGVLKPFSTIQRLAYQRDWSDGYVATATKPR
ncbi:MAG: class I SAM-dependent methyltransferase [Acidimicrobiales bacterium]